MTLGTFQDHKREYISFFVIAILIIIAARMVRVSEAQAYPFEYGPAGMTEGMPRPCPPFLRHFHGPFLFSFFHPCVQPQEDMQSVAPVTPTVSTSTDATSTDATTTPDTATSTATSTPEEASSAASN
jgi:hypothetical protein